MIIYETIDEARGVKLRHLAALAPGCPLRFHPAITHGPDGGYVVITLGELIAADAIPLL